MNGAAIFMLAALLPAAANPSLLARAGGIQLPVCSADGLAPVVSIRLGAPELPGSQAVLCCAKGCQSGDRKKKSKRA